MLPPSEQRKEPLAAIVEQLVTIRRQNGSEGISCKELATLGKAPAHINQILTKLCVQGKIIGQKEKRDIRRKTTIYFKSPPAQEAAEAITSLRTTNHYKAASSERSIPDSSPNRKKPTCGNCQKFSGIKRCILLDLATKKAPWSLKGELKERFALEELAPNTPACPYYDPRVNGHCKSKTLNTFISQNLSANPWTFYCPIVRCRQPIEALSYPLRVFRLGSSAFYCPHCGSPMIFGYNEALDRYEVKYWDAHYDFLQRDFEQLTGLVLPQRKTSKQFGASIGKAGSYALDLKVEVLYLGDQPSCEEETSELAPFPLRELNYIAVSDWADYFALKRKLHAELADSIIAGWKKKLYAGIEIFEPRKTIASVAPTEKEVGGNEIIIATGVLNLPCLMANVVSREALLRKTKTEVSPAFQESFAHSERRIQQLIDEYSKLGELSARQWQQKEGGCGSLMYAPFKEEARSFGFSTPSRVHARMVQGEPFLPYGLYYARSDYHSLINGVNHVIISALKEQVYNEVPLAWDGLRGWCHQNYSKGLLYDSSEQAKQIGLFCVNQAIREELITPKHFVERRGKRYEPLYCVLPSTEGEAIIKQIARTALRTKLFLSEAGRTTSLLGAYKYYTPAQKKLLNGLARGSAQVVFWEEQEKTKGLRQGLAP